MAKNVVFCADGTWNGPGEDFDGDVVSANPTNVLKIYHWLSGTDTIESTKYAGEAERVETDANGTTLQVSKYIDGVGYDDNWLVKILGGVFGAGLITRIVRGYTFISRNYSAGDRIYIIGFSRGAYTARALAGLILEQGLLNATNLDLPDKVNAYRMGCAIWWKHQQQIMSNKPVDLLARIEETISDLPGFFAQAPSDKNMISNISIQTVAVWDTVGAMGIPQYKGEDKRIDAFRFDNLTLNSRVTYGFHAISLDEQRVDFTPTLWNPRDNVTQNLFPGAHADVGGGYPVNNDESDLSNGALVWMQANLARLPGDTRVNFGNMPAGIKPIASGTAHQPWIYMPYKLLDAASRKFPNEHGLSQSDMVKERQACGPVKPDPSKKRVLYKPKNIPTP